MVTVNKPYTIACGDNNIDLQKVTWAQVEEQLYAKLNMSKEAFEDAYELDGGTADANQFEKATTDAEALAADKKIGTVSQTTADIEGMLGLSRTRLLTLHSRLVRQLCQHTFVML